MKNRAMTPAIAARMMGDLPLVAVDVGAARGLLPHWEPLASFARLVLIEPDLDAIPLIRSRLDTLNARDVVILPYGVSEDGGPKTLHQLATRSSSSLLPFDLPDALDYSHAEWIFPQSETTVATRTLASALDENAIDDVHMIKLDTQGTELAILRGMGDRARRLLSLEIEVGTADGYVGKAELADVLAFADSCGLELFDLTTKRASMVHAGAPGFYERLFGTYVRSPSIGTRLVEVDALFFRKRRLLLEEGDPAQIRRAATVLSLHGRFAQAHRLLELAGERKILSPDLVEDSQQAIVVLHKRTFVSRVAVDVAEKVVQKLGERLVPTRWMAAR